MTAKPPVTVTLQAPLPNPGGEAISAVTLTRPNVGALRGLKMSLLQMQDVATLCTLLPRITQPALSPSQIEALDAADFTALANEVALFFMSPEQLSLVRAMSSGSLTI